MKNAKRKILEMIEQGKITAEEGLELLKILEQKAKEKAEKRREEGLVSVGKQQGDIIKLSPHEYEVLPVEKQRKKELVNKKKQKFGGIPFINGRKLVIRVEEKGKSVVNIKLPVGFIKPFIKGSFKVASHKNPEVVEYIKMVDKEELEKYLNGDMIGPIIDVYDEEDDTHVYIGIE